ncbi:MAG: hypothetical protein HFJ41_02095 [Clostridia bacterium]|nr:hypothetical protein [Clostridia bacterium]
MSKTMEQRTVIEVEGKITRVSIEGGKIEIFSIPEYLQNQEGNDQEEIKGTQEYIEKYFPIVKASTLSLEDEFLKHEPETEEQRKFKNALISAIKSGLSDFRAQRMDACFDEEGNICFKAGMKPAVGKLSANDWKRVAKEFLPEKGSRLGTTKERIAFLGLLIKYLIEEKGYTVSNAWKAVCNQSRDLGHYADSENPKRNFEDTGSRQVGEWCDLGNTFKITEDDEAGGFSLVGGDYVCNGDYFPLAGVFSVFYPIIEYDLSVGWFVLSV